MAIILLYLLSARISIKCSTDSLAVDSFGLYLLFGLMSGPYIIHSSINSEETKTFATVTENWAWTPYRVEICTAAPQKTKLGPFLWDRIMGL